MARTVEILLTSDLSGGADAVTVEFGWAGRSYEIDVTEGERAELEGVLAPYVRAGRLVTSGRGGRRAAAAAAGARGAERSVRSGPEPSVVRAWAGANGVEVPARGRIPVRVVEAYLAAENGGTSDRPN